MGVHIGAATQNRFTARGAQRGQISVDGFVTDTDGGAWACTLAPRPKIDLPLVGHLDHTAGAPRRTPAP